MSPEERIPEDFDTFHRKNGAMQGNTPLSDGFAAVEGVIAGGVVGRDIQPGDSGDGDRLAGERVTRANRVAVLQTATICAVMHEFKFVCCKRTEDKIHLLS